MKDRKKIPKSKRRRLREVRLQKLREAHRLARLNVKYNPNKQLIGKHTPRLNERFKEKAPIRGRKIISLPMRMNFGDDIEDTVSSINDLHNEIIYGDAYEIFIDQRDIECVSPDAALVLIAEINRCLEYSSSRRVRSNYPRNNNVAKLLTDIGFYRFLNVRAPVINENESNRFFVKVSAGNESVGRVADNLISNFEKVIKFDPLSRKRLYASLIECMDNVHAHAYVENRSTPDLLGEWWMSGFCDPGTGQVAFVFYDQGVGIPTTLKEKLTRKVKSYLNMDDSKIIKNAVEKGVTRTESKRHGQGLPSLKDFIDELSPSGFLRVISNKGDFMYCKNFKSRSQKIQSNLNGSLIVWTIEADPSIVSPEGIIDLSKENAQLRLQL